MSTEDTQQGGCLCGATRYEITGTPMIVHACHCTTCQRRFGTPMAVNLWIEESRVKLLFGEPVKHGELVGEEGQKTEGWACSECGFGLWTVYHSAPKGSRPRSNRFRRFAKRTASARGPMRASVTR